MEQTRRKFIKTSAAFLTSLGMGTSFLNCGPSLKEVNKGIENVMFECNPILPIQKRGCYTGTNKQSNTAATEVFPERYGIPAAFNAPGQGTFWVSEDNFPTEDCEWLYEHNIIPLIRYVAFPFDNKGYRNVIAGKTDDQLKVFAAKAAKHGKPVVFTPWQCVNEPRRHYKIWGWSQADPGEYKSAWVHMHEIFQQEGANRNVVWSTKLISWGFTQNLRASDPFSYIPPKEYVDIIGWNCNSNLKWNGGLSFNSMFRDDYVEAVKRYGTKPQWFWEIGADREGYQSGWMDSALMSIREDYPFVKGIMFDEHASHG